MHLIILMILKLILGREEEVLTCLQKLTYFVNCDTPEWMLLKQVNVIMFYLENVYLEFVAQQYPKTNMVIDKYYFGYLTSKGESCYV